MPTYNIKNRRDGLTVAYVTEVTLIRALVGNSLIQGAPPKESWAFVLVSGPIPIQEFYVDPLPDGFPIEAGSPDLRISKINFGDK
jgi:hypothetical protein